MYQSANLSQINIAEYIKSLAPNLLQSYGPRAARIALHLELADSLLEIDKAIPLGLIVNELISNSVKHAFAPGTAGDIWLRLRAEAGEVCLMVADNGVGLPPGLDFQNTGTLGLQLVNTLTNQLGGTITVSNTGQAEFTVRFKDD